MNKNVLETQWVQIREILKDKFSNLTEEDIRQINGQYDQLVAKLQQKYGYSKEEAEQRILNWNFDRLAASNEQIPEEKVRREENLRREDRVSREEGDSSLLKWLLAIAIPLVILGTYFFVTNNTPENARQPTAVREQVVNEPPADRLISNGLRNNFQTQPNLASELQNVQITTNNGVVTLSGSVSSKQTSDLMAAAAQNFAGVKRVVNNLQVK